MKKRLSPIELLEQQQDMLRLMNLQVPGGRWAVVMVIDGYYANHDDAEHSLKEFVKETGIPEPEPYKPYKKP
jgi:hypothetical protein